MAIDLVCPTCSGRDLRPARVHGFWEQFLELGGVYQLRCKSCKTRFSARLWELSQVRYAHCPKCYRTELSTWSEPYFTPGPVTKAMVLLGANRYRCEFCRCNFASFRACVKRFSWPKPRRSTLSIISEPLVPVVAVPMPVHEAAPVPEPVRETVPQTVPEQQPPVQA